MTTVDLFDTCLSDLFSAFSISDTQENRDKGKSILLSYFGIDELAANLSKRESELVKLAASLTSKEEELDNLRRQTTSKANGLEESIRASLQEEFDKRSRMHDREVESKARESVKSELAQQKADLQREYDEKMSRQDQELFRKATEIAKAQADKQSQELDQRTAALDKRQQELDTLAATLAHKRKTAEDRPGYIYEFRDPDTHVPVYVGQTIRDPEDRAYDHMKAALDKDNALHSWIANLYYNQGKLPELAHMRLESEKMMDRAERERIKELLRQGIKLFNVQLKIPRLITKMETLYIGAAMEEIKSNMT